MAAREEAMEKRGRSRNSMIGEPGCTKIFNDKITGSRMDRPNWDQLLKVARPGDVLVVADLSRMTRSLMHLLKTAQALDRKQVNLVSLRENIDTNTTAGRCFLSMMDAIDQMERELRVERADAGRASVRAREDLRRPRTDLVKLRDAKMLYDNSGMTALFNSKLSRRLAASESSGKNSREPTATVRS